MGVAQAIMITVASLTTPRSLSTVEEERKLGHAHAGILAVKRLRLHAIVQMNLNREHTGRDIIRAEENKCDIQKQA